MMILSPSLYDVLSVVTVIGTDVVVVGFVVPAIGFWYGFCVPVEFVLVELAAKTGIVPVAATRIASNANPL